MKLLIKSSSKSEIRAFLFAEKVPITHIHRRLVAVYGDNVILIQAIRKWCGVFKAGRESIEIEHRAGRSIEMHTEENRRLVEKVILSDRRVTISEVEAATGLARCQIHQFIHELGF
ncbi:hypothetical protein PGB90_004922 [Kerria lacca]